MASPNTSASINPYRWVICALLFFATTINYIDRQILALLKPILDEQLHWTNAQYGLINSAFQGAYAISLLGFGWLVDRKGVKFGYALSIFAWSLAAIGHVFAASVNGFAVARVALGLGEGGNFPAAVKATALWFAKKERAFATSLFNAGSNAGAMIAPMSVPFIAYQWGWHMAFIVAGALGFIWLIFWFALYKTPDQMGLGPPEPEPEIAEAQMPWGSLLGYRQTWSFIVAKFLTDPVWWFFLIWLPDYFKKTRDLDLKSSWVHLFTIYFIVTVLSIAGGWVTGYLTKFGWSITRARKTSMFFFALCVMPIVFATQVGEWQAVMLIGLAGAAHQAWSANLYTTVSDMFPKDAVASVIGLGGMAGCVGGILLPIITGELLDHFHAQGYTILFVWCGAAYLIAFGLNHLLAPKFVPFNTR